MKLCYWRDANFRGLAELRARICGEPELHEYSEYFNLREKGLRHRAREHLARFIHTATDWPFDHRKQFVNNTRIEITGDVDPDLDRLNDYLGVLDVLSRFDNIVLFDPENVIHAMEEK